MIGSHSFGSLRDRPRSARMIRWLMDRWYAWAYTRGHGILLDMTRRALVERQEMKLKIRRLETELREATE